MHLAHSLDTLGRVPRDGGIERAKARRALVSAVDIGAMVLVVMQLHDLSTTPRLPRRVVKREVGEDVGRHAVSEYPEQVRNIPQRAGRTPEMSTDVCDRQRRAPPRPIDPDEIQVHRRKSHAQTTVSARGLVVGLTSATRRLVHRANVVGRDRALPSPVTSGMPREPSRTVVDTAPHPLERRRSRLHRCARDARPAVQRGSDDVRPTRGAHRHAWQRPDRGSRRDSSPVSTVKGTSSIVPTRWPSRRARSLLLRRDRPPSARYRVRRRCRHGLPGLAHQPDRRAREVPVARSLAPRGLGRRHGQCRCHQRAVRGSSGGPKHTRRAGRTSHMLARVKSNGVAK